MPDENRVFDVSRPSHVKPQATSKPVIVGHHPVMNDPMVKEDPSPKPTKIAVFHDAEEPRPAAPATEVPAPEHDIPALEHHDTPLQMPVMADKPAEPEEKLEAQTGAPAIYEDEPETPAHSPEPAPTTAPPEGEPAAAAFEMQPLEPLAPAHVEALHPSKANRRGGRLKWVILALLLVLAAAYLLIDSGAIKTNISLPFHVFKQKTTPPPAPSNTSSTQNTAAQTALPAGFTEYKLSGTNITFAAPSEWGTPSSTTDPGYSKRGNNNQSDGTYAYLVSFSTNKDVQIAVTSSQYLPAARATQYYDYLKWCVGSADGKIYTSILHFTTSSDKVDTPSTITCDQGPLTDATKLDSTTIVQLATKDASGAVIGDLYTKNLADQNLPVMRIKDAKSANSVQIKQLLSTVKLSVSGSSAN